MGDEVNAKRRLSAGEAALRQVDSGEVAGDSYVSSRPYVKPRTLNQLISCIKNSRSCSEIATHFVSTLTILCLNLVFIGAAMKFGGKMICNDAARVSRHLLK
jgi:hypothetical protein